MTQKFIVTVNSVVITEKVSGASISEQMQRIYNTASFTCDDIVLVKSIVKIELGDKTFDGFIYSAIKNDNGKYAIQCRTAGGYLTTPFISNDTEVVIPAKTSHTLCAYYATEYGIPIVITAIDLDFGGDYVQKGTPLSALVSIANTTGADYWFDGTSIRIEPAKWIESQGEDIPNADIFDYVPLAKTIEQRGVGTIIVGNKSSSTDRTIQISCNAEVDGCNSQVMLRIIPHTAYEYSKGLNSVSEVQTPLVHKGVLSVSSYLSLEADIVSITSVKVDGATVSDYTFVNNTIIFSTPKRGMVMVEYIGYGYTAYANTKWVDSEKIAAFTVYYNECDVYNFDGVLTCTGSDNRDVENDCGGVIVIMPKETNYIRGFSFTTLEESPTIYFYNDSTRIVIGRSTVDKAISRLEPAALSTYTGGGVGVRHAFRFTKASVLGVQSKGVNISYTSDADYVYLSKFYPAVTIAYTTNGQVHTVQNANIADSNVIMVIAGPNNDDQCEYPLKGAGDGALSCSLGDSVVVDIMGIHGATLESCTGKTVTVTPPSGSSSSYTVDDMGAITITSVLNGTYTIDTDNIWANSYIKMISYAT